MDLGLTGKHVLVMGSTRGMGYAIAANLVAEGASVAVCGRQREDAAAATDALNKAGPGNAKPYALDLSDDVSLTAFIDAVGADFGTIDIVVCNGGGPPPGPISGVAPELWLAQFQTMFVNQIRIVNSFLPGMRERGWGRILTIASSGIIQPIPGLGISNTIRASQIGWSKTLAGEVAGVGVTVNTVIPGRIKTDRVDQIDAAAAKRQDKPVAEIVRASQATIPAGRYGTPEEFADVATFVLSERASYVTGGVIRIDGGMIRSV